MSQKTARSEQTLSLSTPAFAPESPIPRKHTCDGEDVSPALVIGGVPETAKTLALVMDDLDAPGGTFNHWLVWNLPASTRELPENVEVEALGGAQGRNDFGVTQYRGPCPPPGDTHRYNLRFWALTGDLELEEGADRKRLDAAMQDKTVASGVILGTYKRA